MNERLKQYLDKAGEYLSQFSKKADISPPQRTVDSADTQDSQKSTSSSLSKVLFGSAGALGEYYFPAEILGGTCPAIAGEEENIVWNAAAEACDTEKVHVVWTTYENRLWYLAVRSADLASHPFSWCPFASVLPSLRNSSIMPVCYTYYSEDVASMMSITSESLQIFRGTSLVVRAKAERTARELGNAAVIELNPDIIMQLAPIPWYSLSLFEDRARRILATVSILAATAISLISLLIWLSSSVSLLSARQDLEDARNRTTNKTLEMLRIVQRMRASPIQEQLAKFVELNDGLLDINGLLEVYDIREGKTRWRATIPANVTADRINKLDGRNIGNNDAGTIIGNPAQIEYESTMKDR